MSNVNTCKLWSPKGKLWEGSLSNANDLKRHHDFTSIRPHPEEVKAEKEEEKAVAKEEKEEAKAEPVVEEEAKAEEEEAPKSAKRGRPSKFSSE